jgi:hypothetical protein
MTSQSGKNDALEPVGPSSSAVVKKPYHSPELKAYGDLARITSGSGGGKADATPPGGKSKA